MGCCRLRSDSKGDLLCRCTQDRVKIHQTIRHADRRRKGCKTANDDRGHDGLWHDLGGLEAFFGKMKSAVEALELELRSQSPNQEADAVRPSGVGDDGPPYFASRRAVERPCYTGHCGDYE